jgi:hypothetical protein
MLSKIKGFLRTAGIEIAVRGGLLVEYTISFITSVCRFFGRYLQGCALVAFGIGLGAVTGIPIGAAGTVYVLHRHGPEIGQYAMDYGVRLLGMTSTSLRWDIYSSGDEAINDPKMKFAAPLARREEGKVSKADLAPSDMPYPEDVARADSTTLNKSKKKR